MRIDRNYTRFGLGKYGMAIFNIPGAGFGYGEYGSGIPDITQVYVSKLELFLLLLGIE